MSNELQLRQAFNNIKKDILSLKEEIVKLKSPEKSIKFKRSDNLKIIIISAGTGSRMMPLTRNTPKGLLELGNGLSVLETQLEAIKKTSIKDVVIIVGYLAEQIDAKILKYKSDLNIKTIYNPLYYNTNNLVTVWFAKGEMTDNFILVNGDDVFKSKVLQKLIDEKEDIGMVIDKKKNYDEDDMKVVVKDNQILEVSKKIGKKSANGESIGMIKFQNGANIKLRDTLNDMIKDKENHQIFYLQAIQKLMSDGEIITPVEISENDWAEIDFHEDLDSVKGSIEKFHKEFLKSIKL